MEIGDAFMKLPRQMMIGDILIARGAITRSQLNMAMKFHEPARTMGKALVAEGVISPDDLDMALGWLLAEVIVGLGYAGEREVFGSLRIGVASELVKAAGE